MKLGQLTNMAESFNPPTLKSSSSRTWRKKWLGSLVFFGLTILAMMFAVNVFNYYRQIKHGEIDASQLAFATTQVSAGQLQALVQAAPGSGELASEDDPSLGPSQAKLTIVEFADFGCPYSEEESYVVTALAQQYPEVRFIYRDFPLTDIHPGADLAAQAGECAQQQASFWDYHELMYRHSGDFTAEVLLDYASQLDLDTRQFAVCLESEAVRREVAQDAHDGVLAGVEGTPTFFFNGQKISGAIPYQTFVELIEAFVVADS